MKAGDKVRLNTGGPLMSVESELVSGWKCVWWDEKLGKFCDRIFPEEVLVNDINLTPEELDAEIDRLSKLVGR